MRLPDGMLTAVHRDADADVLVITNMWPEPERPVYGIHVQRQVESTRQAGVRCDVLYLRGYLSPLAYPVAAIRLATLRGRGRYRLVHVHAGETSLAARFLLGLPMLVSYVGDDVLGDPRADGSLSAGAAARAWTIRTVSRFFTHTITKSRVMHDRLPRATRTRNSVLPNGVDTTSFRPLDPAAARAHLGWEADQLVALFAGTRPDSPAKRLPLAEDAVRHASERLGRPVRLHVAGSVDPAEMPQLMNAANCLLLTSAVEGSPNVVKEALMCNLPVVSTPVGDVEELLAGVEPSAVCAPDARLLGEAVADCLARDIRSNGRERSHRLAADQVAQRLLALYAEVGGSHAPDAAEAYP